MTRISTSLLKYADSFCHDAYYARMAMAWMISLCFIKFPQKTMEYLKHSTLDNWTYNKALQKTIESFRVDKEHQGHSPRNEKTINTSIGEHPAISILFTVLLISYRRYRFYFPPNLFFVRNPEKH